MITAFTVACVVFGYLWVAVAMTVMLFVKKLARLTDDDIVNKKLSHILFWSIVPGFLWPLTLLWAIIYKLWPR